MESRRGACGCSDEHAGGVGEVGEFAKDWRMTVAENSEVSQGVESKRDCGISGDVM